MWYADVTMHDWDVDWLGLTNSRFFLLECDICVIKLMDDLEAIDDEFCALNNQLESFSRNVTSYTRLDKLEDAIAGTKVLTTISYNSTLEC